MAKPRPNISEDTKRKILDDYINHPELKHYQILDKYNLSQYMYDVLTYDTKQKFRNGEIERQCVYCGETFYPTKRQYIACDECAKRNPRVKFLESGRYIGKKHQRKGRKLNTDKDGVKEKLQIGQTYQFRDYEYIYSTVPQTKSIKKGKLIQKYTHHAIFDTGNRKISVNYDEIVGGITC